MTALVMSICTLAYFAGYRRYSKKILESEDSDSVPAGRSESGLARFLDRTVLKNPSERATFHFIGLIASRSFTHRILTALYIGIGIALAFSSLFVFDRRIVSTVPFRLSMFGVLQAPIILSFLTVTGLRASFNVPHELGANWVFQITGGSNSSAYLKAIRKWV